MRIILGLVLALSLLGCGRGKKGTASPAPPAANHDVSAP
jgi:hypothetical protein